MKWRRKKDRHESILLLEQQRAEKLAELGDLLRQSRQKQNLSLDKVAAKTLIQRRLLEAIEAGQLNELPEPIYTQGLIKRYADTLGLNGKELSSSFPTSYTRLSIKPSWRIPTAQLRPIHLYLLYIIVIICAVNALSHMLSPELQASSSHQEKQEPPLDQGRRLPRSANLASVSTSPNAASKTTKPVRIDITLKASSWIRVVADGKMQFEGLLPEGTQRTWVAQEQLTVRAGNAGGVLVTFNQEKAKQLGSPGEVQEVTFAANSRSQ